MNYVWKIANTVFRKYVYYLQTAFLLTSIFKRVCIYIQFLEGLNDQRGALHEVD